MLSNWKLISVLSLCFLVSQAWGQSGFVFHELKSKTVFKVETAKQKTTSKYLDMNQLVRQPVEVPKYRHTAFFCKLEDKIYAKSKMNVRFNLGSNAYVNFLEGKAKNY